MFSDREGAEAHWEALRSPSLFHPYVVHLRKRINNKSIKIKSVLLFHLLSFSSVNRTASIHFEHFDRPKWNTQNQTIFLFQNRKEKRSNTFWKNIQILRTARIKRVDWREHRFSCAFPYKTKNRMNVVKKKFPSLQNIGVSFFLSLSLSRYLSTGPLYYASRPNL